MSCLRLLLVSLIIAVFATGCAGMKNWEFAQMRCCQKGVLAGMAAGASTGAIIGYQSREEGEGAAIGAATGALIGGIMGKLLCKKQVLDSDGDGVPDDLDRCPNTPQGVAVNPQGCPPDSDGDGVPDYLDKCPNTPKGVQVDANGCPLDSDGDGVYDYMDKCPGTPEDARVDARGCWVLKGVLFDTAKWNIKSCYNGLLGEVVQVLRKNPDLKIEIQGHTDNIGTKKYNQILSENRGKAVLEYLVKKGIDRGHLTYIGYGFSKPATSNSTPEGRAMNRRVELKPIR